MLRCLSFIIKRKRGKKILDEIDKIMYAVIAFKIPKNGIFNSNHFNSILYCSDPTNADNKIGTASHYIEENS